MRKSIQLFAALTLTIAAGAQKNKEVIEGNGRSEVREIPVSSFESLRASGVYELRLVQGNSESVKIVADENIQEYFTVKNEGNTLIINTDKLKSRQLKQKGGLKVYVSFKNLNKLQLSMVGNVKSEAVLSFDDLDLHNRSVGNVDLQLKANKLILSNNSVGNLSLEGKASEAVLKNKSVGNVNAGSFVVQTMAIDQSGIGNVEVNAAKSLNVADNALGKIHNKGAAILHKTNKVRV